MCKWEIFLSYGIAIKQFLCFFRGFLLLESERHSIANFPFIARKERERDRGARDIKRQLDTAFIQFGVSCSSYHALVCSGANYLLL